MNDREIAYAILESIDLDGAYSHVALSKGIPNQLSKQNADFIRHLVLGVLEKRGILDHIIQKLSFKSSKRKVRQLLRLAIYQILFMDRTPRHAIVDESVRMCKKIAPQSSGFVNALLRKVEPSDYLNQDFANYPDEERLSILYSMPDWLVKRWLNRYGVAKTEAIFVDIRKKPKLYLRLNVLKAELDELKNELTESQVKWAETEFDSLVEVTDLQENGLDRFAMLQDGKLSVQDLAAFLVGEAIPLKSGDRVLDACAAPGGKSAHLAEKSKDIAILSLDLYPAKVEQMENNFLKRGYTHVQCQVHDSRISKEEWLSSFDVVVLDAPCSGLGIISRKPELPYHKMETDIQALAELQKDLIEVQSSYVKNGGYLVYATCTVEPEENEDQVRGFISRHPEFEICHLEAFLPEKYVQPEGWVSLLPGELHDGFYIALLKKITR